MDINIFNEQQDLPILSESVEEVVKSVLNLEGAFCDEIAIHFVKTPVICQLHEEFFNDPTTTDCISFPLDEDAEEGYRVLGEVFVCPETAIANSAKYKTDEYYEATLYLVHGILHLLGYDDVGNAEPAMRAAERKHMDELVSKNKLLKSD